jgi:hypothetical protein
MSDAETFGFQRVNQGIRDRGLVFHQQDFGHADISMNPREMPMKKR